MADDNEEEAKTIAIGCLAIIIVTPFAIMLRGFVLTRLWLWFLVPLGLPAIGLWHAYGLSILIALFTSGMGRIPSNKDEDERRSIIYHSVFRLIGYSIGGPLLLWLLGLVCYCAM